MVYMGPYPAHEIYHDGQVTMGFTCFFFWCMVIPSWKSLFAHPHDWGMGLYVQFSTPFFVRAVAHA